VNDLGQLSYEGLTGEVITPQSPLYAGARQEWNRAIQKFPAAIVYCANKYDVRNAVVWARSHCIPLRIRGGGHNYEGFSTGDGVLVIDISRMKCIRLDRSKITMECGVQFAQLYGVLGPLGIPFPGGTCPTVGIAGFVQGGGSGLSSRYLGLGCDSLLEAELVDDDGRLIHASERENADLFWAIRGAGGGNFGVVVSLTFRLAARVDRVCLVDFFYTEADQQKRADYWLRYQAWIKEADPRISATVNFYREDDQPGMNGRALFYGGEAEARQLMQPLEDIAGGTYTYRELPLFDALLIMLAGFPSSQMFKSTGRFVVKPLTLPQIEEISSFFESSPEGALFTAVTLYGLGGRVAEKSPRDTAFFYRDTSYIIGIQSVWEDPQYAAVNTAWVEDKFEYIKSVTAGSYVNFPISPLARYAKEYYGGNAEALSRVKQKYDPCSVFCYPQCIRPNLR
jgi:hypothetical protein